MFGIRKRKNLLTIRDHYHQFSPDTAKKVTRGIVLAIRRLSEWPATGRVVPEIEDPDFREVIWNNWRIIYVMPLKGEEP